MLIKQPESGVGSSMNILVTGGAGFIGSAVVRYLINNTNMNVINVDKLSHACDLSTVTNVSGNTRYSFEQCDIEDPDLVSKLFVKYKPSYVMNIVAEKHVDRSISGPMEFEKSNVNGTFNLLNVSRAYWLNLPKIRRERFRFLQVSTAEVFCDLGRCESEFSESTPSAPSPPLSAIKAGADHLVKAWHQTYGLPVLITHCANNYGPYQHPENPIPLMITNALRGKSLPLYGEGKQVRDWLHVNDHAEALVTVLQKANPGSTYKIGGSNEYTNLSVMKNICKHLNKLSPSQHLKIHKYEELITHVRDRAAHDISYALDASLIKSELGWTPKYRFVEGLGMTIQWYLDNWDWAETRIYGNEENVWEEAS